MYAIYWHARKRLIAWGYILSMRWIWIVAAHLSHHELQNGIKRGREWSGEQGPLNKILCCRTTLRRLGASEQNWTRWVVAVWRWIIENFIVLWVVGTSPWSPIFRHKHFKNHSLSFNESWWCSSWQCQLSNTTYNIKIILLWCCKWYGNKLKGIFETAVDL